MSLSLSLSPCVSLTNKFMWWCYYRSQGRKSANAKPEPLRVSPLIPPPPSSKKPTSADSSMIDYLSGDVYKSKPERSPETSEPTPYAVPSHSNSTNSTSPWTPALSSSSPPSHFINPTASPMFTAHPVYDEPAPMSKPADPLPSAPWDAPSPNSIPPPPSKYNQRQQFFEQQHASLGSPYSSSGSSSDSLVGQTQNLSINSSSTTKQVKQEDALFKDLVDFAKAKSSSSSKPNRSFWVGGLCGEHGLYMVVQFYEYC